MWNSGEDIDFGDEDDVDALLAKARSDLPSNARAHQGRDTAGHMSGGALQQNIRPVVEEAALTPGALLAQDCGNRSSERIPTVSSSSFSIKQHAARSQSNADQTFSFEAPVPFLHPSSSSGQPLANVTNSLLTRKRLQSALPTQNVDPQKDSRFANAFKVPFPRGANSQGIAGAKEASRSVNPPTVALSDTTPARQATNASASTSGSEESAPQRRFDAAEKGKRVLSEFENNIRRMSLEPDEAAGATKQARPKQTVIPGPAGAVQRALAQGRSSAEAQRTNAHKQAPLPLEALPDEDFSKGPWLAAVEFVRNEEINQGALEMTQLRDLRKGTVSKRTAHLVVIVKSMTPTGEGDVFATVKDVSGTLEGTLHRRLLADKQLGPISAGTVLVLHQVAIFRPVPRTCYLNIMAKNVLKVFPTKTPIPTTRSSSRAAADPVLAEPSWDDFPQVPSTSTASGSFASPTEPSRFWETGAAQRPGQRSDKALGNGSLRVGDAPGIVLGAEDQSPELPSLSPSGSAGFGDPQIDCGRSVEGTETGARLPSAHSPRFAQHLSNRPHPRSTGPTLSVNPIPGSVQSEPGGQVPAGLFCDPPVSFAAGGSLPEGGGLTTKRGRDAWDAPQPAGAPAGRAQGPAALNVDIQQLLAGLDEEDWFLPGEEAPPPNKKSREVEETLPF